MAQERRVLLANGQYITIVQTTGTSSGDVMSQSAVTAALSAKANVSHTHNASSITGGTFGTARIADGAITKAKLGSDVPISTTSYEIVKISGLTSGGAAAVGAEVTIGCASYKFDSTGSMSVQIPYGQVYKIQTYSNDAWVGGYEATFTANTPSRSISITYNEMIVNGVFIEATDGTLYTSSNWNSSKSPNSIVVAGDGIRFRIALSQPSSTKQMTYYVPTAFQNYMTPITGMTQAKVDYDGAENTAKILYVVSSTAYPAGYCDAFVFPDGKTKGYLPSLGQLYLAYQNKAAVDAALSACGGTVMVGNAYWSSTFRGDDDEYGSFWGLYWNNGSILSHSIEGKNYVRPFAAY